MSIHCVGMCVCPPVPPEDPIVDGSPELLLMAGAPYNLTCVTRGAKPAAHIEWNKDGVPVEGAYHSTVTHTLIQRLYLCCANKFTFSYVSSAHYVQLPSRVLKSSV